MASTISEESQASEERVFKQNTVIREFLMQQSKVSKAAHNCTLSQNTDLHG